MLIAIRFPTVACSTIRCTGRSQWKNNPAALAVRYHKITSLYYLDIFSIPVHSLPGSQLSRILPSLEFGDGTGKYPRAGKYNHSITGTVPNRQPVMVDTTYCKFYPESWQAFFFCGAECERRTTTASFGCAPYTAISHNTYYRGSKYYWNLEDGARSTPSMCRFATCILIVGPYTITMVAWIQHL